MNPLTMAHTVMTNSVPLAAALTRGISCLHVGDLRDAWSPRLFQFTMLCANSGTMMAMPSH
jgi:hypothetical protein